MRSIVSLPNVFASHTANFTSDVGVAVDNNFKFVVDFIQLYLAIAKDDWSILGMKFHKLCMLIFVKAK